MPRTILHSDLNGFYASVECLHRPELRGRPLAVGGDIEQRHGIILAKNEEAKRFRIKTGEALWQARGKCPELVIVPPNFPLYLRFSRLAREIYMEYTNQVEAFGIDECWLDVSGSVGLFGNGKAIAEEIRRRIRDELGVTASIGVGDNKIYAKLGSDYKKPDATTVVDFALAAPLPVGDLLYVGSATRKKLWTRGVKTIGELAATDPKLLRDWFGKVGDVLWTFANGRDRTPVAQFDELSIVKSIGNSTTTPRDLTDDTDVWLVLLVLAESVASRMRDHGFEGRTVSISVRDNRLVSFTRQHRLERPTCLAMDIARAAMELFRQSYRWSMPVRSVGVSMTDFTHAGEVVQLDMFESIGRRDNREALERAVEHLRGRFGRFAVQRAALLQDRALTQFNPKQDHTIHPVGYF